MTVTNVFLAEVYFRDQYDLQYVRWMAKHFGFSFVPPSATNHPPPLSLVPPTPLVPSTPLPEGVIFGSPAWEPGSRTPLVQQEGPSDRDETHFIPLPPHLKIPKPPGRAGRTIAWLQTALQIANDVFLGMRVSPNARHRLSLNIPLERF